MSDTEEHVHSADWFPGTQRPIATDTQVNSHGEQDIASDSQAYIPQTQDKSIFERCTSPTLLDSSLCPDDESNEQNRVIGPLFQNVVYFLNPFLGRTRIAEIEEILHAHSATKDDEEQKDSSRRTTHIISDDFDVPDCDAAIESGVHIVKLPEFDCQMIHDAVEAYGGVYSAQVTSDITHLIAISSSGDAYKYVMQRPELEIKIVLPHWFQLCCNMKRYIPEAMYLFPKPPMQRTHYEPPPVQGFAPLLYSNSAKAVVSFLASPYEIRVPFLEGYYILFTDDVTILPELRAKFYEKIQAVGGILVTEYSSDKADIIICRYRSGDVYIKACRDGKAVATVDWLLYVLQIGELCSPKASLLHYPIPRQTIQGISSFNITVTNYTGAIREYLKRMIVATGATYKTTLSKHDAHQSTTHIICGNASGDKYEKGNEWNIKIVNHLWLEDCFLAWSLQSETKPKYTLFPVHNQLQLIFGTSLTQESISYWMEPEDNKEVAPAGSKAECEETNRSVTSTEDDRGDSMESRGSSPGAKKVAGKAIADKNNDAGSVTLSPSSAATPKKGSKKATPAFVSQDRRRSFEPSNSHSPSPLINDATGPSAASNRDMESPQPSQSTTASPTLGNVRILSKRGAAMDASKALQRIVPDMNQFQEQLRDEKRASKNKKKKHVIVEDSRDSEDDSMDVDADEAVPTSSLKKMEMSSPRRKRVSINDPKARSSSPRSEGEGGDKSEGGAIESRTPPKKNKRTTKAEKEMGKERVEEMSVFPATTDHHGSGTAVGTKSKQVRFISTGLKEQTAKQTKALKALGIVPTTSVEKCTHLVAKSIARTEKFLVALAQGKVIVHEDWFQSCIDANTILNENDFQIKDTENEEKFGMKLYKSLDKAREQRVFENCVFYISPSAQPKVSTLKTLVEAGGGKATALLHTGLGFLKETIEKAEKRKGESETIPAERKRKRDKEYEEHSDEHDEPDKGPIIAVVSCEEDKDMWKPILDAGGRIYSNELVISGILTQTVDLGKDHALA
ncbi:hypothetical protein BG011_000115 [Mortierella polycephala]|uniref:BRCT domain-containing protein n=1 Tax=Mortierella polycephala TaxID=41804 RepID=A0A9P6U677_9FUNG|nr:hypothetical protein BG011_000115 [Mortierella polycephala]